MSCIPRYKEFKTKTKESVLFSCSGFYGPWTKNEYPMISVNLIPTRLRLGVVS
jgi:hypothetical protein